MCPIESDKSDDEGDEVTKDGGVDIISICVIIVSGQRKRGKEKERKRNHLVDERRPVSSTCSPLPHFCSIAPSLVQRIVDEGQSTEDGVQINLA